MRSAAIFSESSSLHDPRCAESGLSLKPIISADRSDAVTQSETYRVAQILIGFPKSAIQPKATFDMVLRIVVLRFIVVGRASTSSP